MSEYQYYEFIAKDRALTDQQMAALRRQSTRATITRHAFVNEYSFGNLKGSPADWMRRYFDAHLYAANWGTRTLMFRLASKSLNAAELKRYCGGHAARASTSSGGVVLTFHSESEESEWLEAPSGLLASVEPVREEIATGDHRALYLGWLLRVQQEELAPSVREPPCPPGLDALSPAQEAFVDFLRIDPKLIAAAAERSERLVAPSQAAVKRRIQALSAREKDRLLMQVLAGEHAAVRAELLSATRPRSGSVASGRTVADIIHRAEELRSRRAGKAPGKARRKATPGGKRSSFESSKSASPARRRPIEIEALKDRLAEEIQREEGRGIEAVAGVLGVSTRELVLPVRKLIAEGRIHLRGQKRATRYFGPRRRSGR
jgi:hypothetical protein